MKHLKYLFIILFTWVVHAQKSDFKSINFDRADSIAYAYQGASLKNLPVLTYQLTHGLESRVEQFRAIHTWVCANIESDHDFGEATLRKRRILKNDSLSFSNWNKQVLSKVFTKLLKNKKTICSGYAYLIKELCNLADIPCEIVNGYSRNTTRNVGEVDFPNHSWNAVKLNKTWYLVDATMASGYFDLDKHNFVKDYNDGYFLCEPDLFLKRNYPLDASWMLSKYKPSLEEFVNAPIVYGKTFEHAVTPMAPKTLITNISTGEVVTFKFSVANKTKACNMQLIVNKGFRSEKIAGTEDHLNNGTVELKHQFNKKGQYNAHLVVNMDIVASYTVIVKN